MDDASKHVLLGSRSLEKGKAAVEELQARNKPGTVELIQVDVDSDESIAAAAKEVEQKHGRYVRSLLWVISNVLQGDTCWWLVTHR
jgi:NAD(P)-dependent dehydrogenase (short-subunit alcohol dehydrogenase family)